MLLLQGVDDHVVPPNQAQKMYEAVKEKGNPTALILFEGWITLLKYTHLFFLCLFVYLFIRNIGEGHGWRKAENIKKSLKLEINFYGLLFNFVPNEIEEIIVDNKENIHHFKV